jgi:hypothetical protein
MHTGKFRVSFRQVGGECNKVLILNNNIYLLKQDKLFFYGACVKFFYSSADIKGHMPRSARRRTSARRGRLPAAHIGIATFLYEQTAFYKRKS